jgi:microcystin-dependent protein
MTDFFLGEIEMFGFAFAPKGWALCNGQIMSIQQNTALFAVIGTTYGGNGTTTFGLPDLRGRVAMGQGQGPGLSSRTVGETFGEENHTLLINETPTHNHLLNVLSNPNLANNTDTPAPNMVLAQTTSAGVSQTPTNVYVQDGGPTNSMNPATVGTVGGQPHTNMMPTLVVNYCICLNGIFPSRN